MIPRDGRIDQIALLVADLEEAMQAYIDTFGVAFQFFQVDETTSSFSGSSPQFKIRIAVALAGLTSIELIQPVSGVTLYSQHLESRGPGLHHLGVYVDDLAEVKQALAARGYRTLLEGSIRDLGSFAYLEAPDLHCILEPLQLSVEFPLFLAENASWYSANDNRT